MKIIVTGSQGFVGHHLYNYLIEKGNEVIGVDLEDRGFKQNLLNIDLRKKFDEWSGDIDLIFHLASDVGGSQYINGNHQYNLMCNNLLIDINVINECKRLNKKLVYFSSSCVYDLNNSYGKEKAFAEELIKYSGVDYLIVRPQNLYGIEDVKEGDREQVIMALFRKAMNSEQNIELLGNAKTERSFIHVRDAFEKIYENLNDKKILDLGGEWISIEELTKIIMKICHVNKNVSSKLSYTEDKKKILFDKPKTYFIDGLTEIYNWIQENKINLNSNKK